MFVYIIFWIFMFNELWPTHAHIFGSIVDRQVRVYYGGEFSALAVEKYMYLYFINIKINVSLK